MAAAEIVFAININYIHNLITIHFSRGGLEMWLLIAIEFIDCAIIFRNSIVFIHTAHFIDGRLPLKELTFNRNHRIFQRKYTNGHRLCMRVGYIFIE